MIIRILPEKKEKVVGTWFYILYNCDTKVWYFGQTKESRKDKRHTDPDYTKVIGEWKLQGYKYKTHWIGIDQRGHHLDKKIHDSASNIEKSIERNAADRPIRSSIFP